MKLPIQARSPIQPYVTKDWSLVPYNPKDWALVPYKSDNTTTN